MKIMKRKLLTTGLLVFVFLFGCSQPGKGSVSASLPSGFELVSQDKISVWGEVAKVKEIETGCYYILGRATNASLGAVSSFMEQMYIEKDGVSVPYCD